MFTARASAVGLSTGRGNRKAEGIQYALERHNIGVYGPYAHIIRKMERESNAGVCRASRKKLCCTCWERNALCLRLLDKNPQFFNEQIEELHLQRAQ